MGVKTFIASILLLFSVTGIAQENGTIRFQNQRSEKVMEYNLPLRAGIRVKGEKQRFGRIEEMQGNQLVYSYYHFDTAKVNAIKRMDIKRKQKDVLFDTLTAQSKIHRTIAIDSLDRIEILSADGKLGQQAVMLGSSVLVLGMSFALLQSVSSNVDGSFRTEDYFKVIGIGTGVTLMSIFVKKRFKFQKWTILTPSN
mgnify:FL=1